MTDCPRCGDADMNAWLTFDGRVTCASCTTPEEDRQMRAAQAEGIRRMWARHAGTLESMIEEVVPREEEEQ